MNPKITQIDLHGASSKEHRVPTVPTRVLAPRKPMGTEPFTAQQRECIIFRFLKLHHTVTQIARSLNVGDIAVERVIRFEYWRRNGSRKADRIARAA